MAGVDPLDGTSVDKPVPDWKAGVKKDLRGLRVGIPGEYFIDGLDAEVEGAVQAAISTLRDLGAEVIEISLPHTEAAIAVYYILAPAEASSNLGRFDGARYGRRASDVESLREMYVKSRSQGFGPEVKRRILIGTYVLSTGYYDAYYRQAQKVRTLISQDFASAFDERCDVVVCPTTPTPAFAVGEKTSDPLQMYLNDVFTVPVNLAGLPAMSLPCGFSSAGLPIGFQLIGRPWDEQTLFTVGYAYQQATEWHRRSPARGRE
jgi:aspartyl-tRNA(Asn)/glutamyl-tRNA(Gln) amidotransferase subunit A